MVNGLSCGSVWSCCCGVWWRAHPGGALWIRLVCVDVWHVVAHVLLVVLWYVVLWVWLVLLCTWWRACSGGALVWLFDVQFAGWFVCVAADTCRGRPMDLPCPMAGKAEAWPTCLRGSTAIV